MENKKKKKKKNNVACCGRGCVDGDDQCEHIGPLPQNHRWW